MPSLRRKIVERPITVLMIHASFVVFAFFEMSHLPVELSPESDLPRLSVVTDYPGASSELVVQSITLPIEEAASALDEVKDVSSTSQQGVSIISIQLQKNADVDFVKLSLLEKLSAVSEHLPGGASFPVIVKYVPEDFRQLQGFMTYTIYGDLPLMQMQELAEGHVKPWMLSVKGVASVRILGGANRELYVLIDRNRMCAFGAEYQNVLRALQENQYVQSSGELARGNVRNSVLAGNELESLSDLNDIMIRESGGRGTVRLCDLARVLDSISTPPMLVRINGKPSVAIEIDKEPGINMLDVSSDVGMKVAEIGKSLPSGMRIEKVSDRSADVRREVNELAGKALYAGALILAVVFLFYFRRHHLLSNLMMSTTVVTSVVFSLGAGVIFLSMTGIGLNIMTLAALALSLGIAIDNNVVVSESICREFEKMPDGSGAHFLDLITAGEKQVWLPLTAATFTTAGALLPVYFLPPEMKQFFIPFAETVAVVLISSLLVAFTFLPVTIMFSIRGGVHTLSHGDPKPLSFLKRVYIPTSKWLIRHKKFSIFAAVWLVGFPIWLLPETVSYEQSDQAGSSTAVSYVTRWEEKVAVALASAYNSTFGSKFYQGIRPYIDYGLGGATQLFFRHVFKGEPWSFGTESYLVMSAFAPQGTPIEKTDQFARQIEGTVLPYTNSIRQMTTRLTSEYAAVKIDFSDSAATTAVPFMIKDKLTSLAAQAGGFTVSIAGFGPGFYNSGETAPNFTITVTGYDYESVRGIADNVRAILAKNPRVDNLQIDRLPWESENYEIRARIDRGWLNSVDMGVNQFLRSYMPFVSSSLQRSSILIDNQPLDLIVKFDHYSDQSTENLPNQEIDIGGGKIMRVGDALTFKKSPVMPVIERLNQQYIRYITFDFKGAYELGNPYADEVVKSVSTPPGYEVKRPTNWFTFEAKETVPLVLLSVLAILIVFMITASLYESYKKPMVVLLSVPMSLVGLFAVFFFAGANFGRGGYASVLFLIGLSVNNGILLVDKISSVVGRRRATDRTLRAESLDRGNPALAEPFYSARINIIAGAASERLRPILMTTLVTVSGFLPFVINADIYSFWYPFALGIIGGMIVSALMILLFTPVFYDLIAGRVNSRRKG